MLAWERFPRLYRLYRANPLSGTFLNAETTALRSLVGKMHVAEGPVLDVGSGAGYALDALPGTGRTVVTDLNGSLLAAVRTRHPETLPVRSDALRLPFKNGSFGLITMVGVTEYLADRNAVLRSLHGLLVPGGCLLVTFAHRTFLNACRRLLARRLDFLSDREIGSLVDDLPFTVVDSRRTALQRQYLLQKNKA